MILIFGLVFSFIKNLRLNFSFLSFCIHAEDKSANNDSVTKDININKTGLEDRVSDEINNEIKAYPNPVKDIVRFQFVNTFGEEMNIELYNSAGQLIGKQKTKKDEFDYDISNYSPGLYIYRLITADTIINGKIFRK